MDFRTVVVGTGSVSQFWFPALLDRDDVEIVALVEPLADRAQATTLEHSLRCSTFPTVQDAIEETSATLVVNLTPPSQHRDVALIALDLQCDVIGEKPMAATLAEAVELVGAAERSGRTFAVMQNYRFAPGLRALRDCVASGAVGDPSFLCVDMFRAPRPEPSSFATTMESPLLLDMAIHTFDQMRFLSGLEPVSVYCRELNPHYSWFAGAAAATCDFELTNGALFSYRGSWIADGFSTTYHGAWRIVGSAGTAYWDGEGNPASEAPASSSSQSARRPVNRTEWPAPEPPDHTGHAAAIDDVLDALVAGRRPETDCSDNIKSIAMVFAALESSRTNRRVSIDDVLAEARGRKAVV